MSRKYRCTVEMTLTNSGGDTDWATFKPAANKPIRIRRIAWSQYSELGDAAEEMVRFEVIRLPATVTDGSGGAAGNTPVPIDENDAAAGFTWRTNDTTLTTTSGTAEHRGYYSWNERSTPYEMVFPDAEWSDRVQNAAAIALRQLNTLADDISGQLTVDVEEF